MLKKLSIVAAVIVLMAAALIIFLVLSIDSKIATVVEDNAGRLTGSVVEVRDVDLSIKSGQGVLSGLSIRNPRGFSDNPALYIDTVRFEIDLESLSFQLVPITLIQADGAVILLEKNEEGKVNYQVLSSNMKDTAGAGGSAEESGPSWEPNLRISEFVLNESKVNLAGFGENSREVTIPSLGLKNIGGSAGMPIDKVGEEILSGVFSEVIRLSVQSGIQKWIEENTVLPDALKELLNQGLGRLN